MNVLLLGKLALSGAIICMFIAFAFADNDKVFAFFARLGVLMFAAMLLVAIWR